MYTRLSIVAALAGTLLSPACAPDAPPGGPPASPEVLAPLAPMTEAELQERLRASIQRSLAQRVLPDDVLGEGPGGWDADHRTRDDLANCTTWLQERLADAYGGGDPTRRQEALDAIRYFGGRVSFAARKHYTDRWVRDDPGPLSPVACPTDQRISVRLDMARFRASVGYTCAIEGEDDPSQTVDFMSEAATWECLGSIKPGFYIVFPVASARWLRRHPRVGAMGRVHGLLLDTTGATPTVTHASIDHGRVEVLPFEAYAQKGGNIYLGYTLYGLDHSWRPSSARSEVGLGLERSTCGQPPVRTGDR